MVVTLMGLVAFGVLVAAAAYRQERQRAAHRDVIVRQMARRRIVATTARDREGAR